MVILYARMSRSENIISDQIVYAHEEQNTVNNCTWKNWKRALSLGVTTQAIGTDQQAVANS